MNNQNNIDDELIAKYLGGTTTEEENAEIEHWLGLSIENKNIFEQLENIWFQSQGIKVNSELNFDKKKAFDNVLSRIELANKEVSNKNKIVKLSTYFARIAAVFVIGLSFYFIYQYSISNSENNQDLYTDTNSGQEYLSVDSSYILLPDNSSIYLNSNGNVRYAENFLENRKVFLSGEAFFEVEKSEGKPFIVVTNDIEVKVLGTSFYISSQSKDSILKVGVRTGKVEVKQKSTNEIIQLNANESVDFNKITKSFYEIKPFDLNTLFWKTDELVFNEQPLNEVFDLLSSVYDTQIFYVKEEMNSCIFSGRFSKTSLSEILDQLKLNFNINYSQDSLGKITITGKACN